jgi:hypothetical protein
VQPTPNEKKILRTQLFPSSPHTIRLRGYARSIGTSWSWISALKCVIFGFNGLSRSAAPLVLSPTVNKVVFNLNLITDMEKRSLPPLLSSRRRASARTLVYIFPAMGRQFLPKLEHLARAIVGPGRDSDFPAWRERYIIVNFPRIVEYSIMHSLSRLPPRTAQARFIAMVQRIGGQQSPPVIRAAKGEDSFAEDTSSRTWTDLRIQFLTVGEYRATLLAGEWEEETVGRW